MFCLTFLLHFLPGISYHKVAFIISKISPKVPGLEATIGRYEQ